MSDGACRSCGNAALEVILRLGSMPLANALLTKDQLSEPEARYPLDLAFCSVCTLVQITEVVPPEQLFGDYPYFSSYSATMVSHAEGLVRSLIEQRGLGPRSLAMEMASNDGYLLQHYLGAGVPVLGIEPASNVAAVAAERGIRTRCAFFGTDVAAELVDQKERADIFHAHNVLAHVPDINGVLQGIAMVLKADGVAVIETPYIRDLVDHLEFDTIYHEHLYYYSLTSLQRVLVRNGLEAVAVDRIPLHGGSLRVVAGHAGATAHPGVARLLAEEEALGLGSLDYFRGFADRVGVTRGAVSHVLRKLKAQGRRIAAYGAAAKGTVLLNACGIGTETIDFVVDRNVHKQGRYMPGVHLPILDPENLLRSMPDDVILLTWNFAGEILEQQSVYRARGGRFLIPIPSPRFV